MHGIDINRIGQQAEVYLSQAASGKVCRFFVSGQAITMVQVNVRRECINGLQFHRVRRNGRYQTG